MGNGGAGMLASGLGRYGQFGFKLYHLKYMLAEPLLHTSNIESEVRIYVFEG
jgi:hypothetical protein